MKFINFALIIFIAASVAFAIDNNPQSAGETVPRGAAGLTLDGAMGNPALVGLERQPRGGLSLLPTAVSLWSDKLAPPFDIRIFANRVNPTHALAVYVSNLMRESYDLKGNLTPEETSAKLARELRDGIGIYAGVKTSPFVFATRGFGLSVGTFANADVRIPGGLLLPFFADTAAGLLAGKTLDLSDLHLSALLASEIAVKLGYSTTVPFLRDYLKLDKSAAGAGIKLLLGHAYLDAKMTENSALSYDSASNKYKAKSTLNVLSAGSGLYGGFNYDGKYLVNNPINGQGWGLDIGTVMHNNSHALSIGVRDIGMLLWNGKEVRRGSLNFETDFDMGDLYKGMDGLFNFDTDSLTPVNENHILWLPATLDAGYAYSLQFHGYTSIFLGYLTASAGYSQPLTLGIGRDSYSPGFSAGVALGLLAGYLPVRYGVTCGGPQKLASAICVGLDAKYFSIDAFYKSVGSPVLLPARGFEAGGGLTARWGWRRHKVKDAPAPATPEPIMPAPYTAPEPDTSAEAEFFPEEEAEVVYEPIEINITMLPPPPEPEPLPLPQPTVEETQELTVSQRAINFVTGSANLTESSYAPLNAIAELLARYPHIRYEVQGHTDSQGAEVYNLLLSAERAAVVKYYLMTRGAPETSLVAVGYGKNLPIADNKTVVGRALNRRVEFVQIESQEHYDYVKKFELEMIPRLTNRVLWGRQMLETEK
jgi:outer membrane protein OmpA-like peptidoglycan-associated protein